MVGRGRVLCLSIYSPHPLAVDGNLYHYIWVDVDGRADGRLLQATCLPYSGTSLIDLICVAIVVLIFALQG